MSKTPQNSQESPLKPASPLSDDAANIVASSSSSSSSEEENSTPKNLSAVISEQSPKNSTDEDDDDDGDDDHDNDNTSSSESKPPTDDSSSSSEGSSSSNSSSSSDDDDNESSSSADKNSSSSSPAQEDSSSSSSYIDIVGLSNTDATVAELVNYCDENHMNDDDLPSFNFACKVTSARRLRFALQTFSDLEMIPDLSASLDVDVDGFNITVKNPLTSYRGHLHLKPKIFRCTTPVIDKLVKFPVLFPQLAALTDDENDMELWIYRREGIYQLNFLLMASAEHTIRISAALRNYNVMSEFPKTARFSMAAVPRDICEFMLARLLVEECPRVLVRVKNNMATIKQGKAWKAHYGFNKVDGNRGVEAWQYYYARFPFTHVESLKKASYSDDGFQVLTDPVRTNDIVLKFFLKDLGYLEYLKAPLPRHLRSL